MNKTMEQVQGVGLAAPQIGVSQAIFVFNLEGKQGHVINPKLEAWGTALSDVQEGCLSVPELYMAPSRSQYAKVTGQNMDGQLVEFSGEGLFARMLQHEVDHLNGLLFVDRLEGEDRRNARRFLASSAFEEAVQRANTQRSVDVSTSFGSGSSFMHPGGKGDL